MFSCTKWTRSDGKAARLTQRLARFFQIFLRNFFLIGRPRYTNIDEIIFQPRASRDSVSKNRSAPQKQKSSPPPPRPHRGSLVDPYIVNRTSPAETSSDSHDSTECAGRVSRTILSSINYRFNRQRGGARTRNYIRSSRVWTRRANTARND